MREDWIECTLNDVGNIFSGGTPKTGEPTYWADEISWISPSDLSNYTEKYIEKGKKSISKLGLKKSSAKLFPKNTVLFSCRAPIGYTVIANKEMCTNQGFKSIYPFGEISSEYVYYFLRSAKQSAEKVATGTTFKEISKTAFSKLLFPLPPLIEQKAIVKKIEELFSSLDSGIADLKKAQDQLKIYRQAVLKKAFEGELTKEWRERNDIKREKWSTNKLGEVLKTIDGDRGKNYPKKHELLNEGYCLFLSTKNVRQGEFVFKENLFITKEKDDLLRGGKLERNDVVLTTRGTLGNVALYDSKVDFNNIRINSGMLILRVNNQFELSQPFLMQFINSSLFFQQLKAKQSGTAQPQIPARVLREIEIEIPKELKEQQKIISEIESRLSVCDKVEKDIANSLEKAQALRQSILKKAFEGKLLSEEEIKACKKHKDYEPASVLLERIKGEKKKK